ncbi:MAG: hypothetical protein PHR21_05365 [Oscillospiraceae bacterium]|nr:hypothetical protein [Oscillospiraceae bacterium]MDD4368535.1 hypothetical protein [Oscillospiraceae bacterium]
MNETTKSEQPYSFTSLDVAAYIKWTGLDRRRERKLLQELWTRYPVCLDQATCGHSEQMFCQAVYDQLYYLFERGFVDEHSDLNLVRDPAAFPVHVLSARYYSLELYLRLLTLHFIVTPNLPYVRLDADYYMRRLGFRGLTPGLSRALLKAAVALGLRVARENGFPCDVQGMLEEKLILIGLTASYAASIRLRSGDCLQGRGGAEPSTDSLKS